MIHVAISALVLLSSWSLASAQQLMSVRSGEHGDFTRLTVPVQPDFEWKVEDDVGSIWIKFSDEFGELETSNLFDRIGKNRVLGVSAHDNKDIEVALNCDCGFRAFLNNPSLLVIDISESFPKGNIQISSEFSTHTRPEYPMNMHFPLITEDVENARRDSGRQINLLQSFLQKDLDSRSVNTNKNDQFSSRTIEHNAIGPFFRTDETILHPGLSSRAIAPRLTHGNLRVSNTPYQSEIKIDFSEFNDMKTGCAPEDYFDVNTWGNTDEYLTGLASISAQLYHEFDELSPVHLKSLVRHYIYFGFGAEALAALQLRTEKMDDEWETLKKIAIILDGGISESESVINSNCGAAEILWTLLEGSPGSPLDAAVKEKVLLAFDLLPLHIQEILFPLMKDRVPDFAADIEGPSYVDVSSSNAPDAMTGLPSDRSEHDRLSDISEKSLQWLNEGDRTSNELVVRDFIDLIEEHTANGSDVDQSLADRGLSLAFEERRSAQASEVLRASILALGFAGRFDEAFAQIESNLHEPSDAKSVETVTLVFERLASHADDATFLRHALWREAPEISSRAIGSVISRLVALGFVEQADKLFEKLSDQDRGKKILQSRVALAKNQLLEADFLLLGLEDVEATTLRSEIKLKLNEAFLANLQQLDDRGEKKPEAEVPDIFEYSDRLDDIVDAEDIERKLNSLETAQSLLAESEKARISVRESLSSLPSANN